MSVTIGHLGDNEIAYLVQKYLKERNLSAKTIRYGDYYEMLQDCAKLDVCIITLNLSKVELASLQKKNPHCYVIYITEIQYDVINNPVYYQLSAPIDEAHLFYILDKTRGFVHRSTIFIDTVEGLIRVQTNQITYINTEGRCMAYHFIDGSVIYSKSMRTAFFKELSKNILNEDNFLFLKPNLVLNLDYIIRVKTNAEIELSTGEIIYISKNNYDILLQAWTNAK